MRFALFASLLLAAATSASVIRREESALDVKLSAVDNTKIKAVITNKGSSGFELLNKGTILDNQHIEKVAVNGEGTRNFIFSLLHLQDSITARHCSGWRLAIISYTVITMNVIDYLYIP